MIPIIYNFKLCTSFIIFILFYVVNEPLALSTTFLYCLILFGCHYINKTVAVAVQPNAHKGAIPTYLKSALRLVWRVRFIY